MNAMLCKSNSPVFLVSMLCNAGKRKPTTQTEFKEKTFRKWPLLSCVPCVFNLQKLVTVWRVLTERGASCATDVRAVCAPRTARRRACATAAPCAAPTAAPTVTTVPCSSTTADTPPTSTWSTQEDAKVSPEFNNSSDSWKDQIHPRCSQVC